MVRTLDSTLLVWDEMKSLLDTHGFQPYPIPDIEDSDTETTVQSVRPRTIIQLVRGAVGVAPSHAGRSTDSFWNSTVMAETLQRLWEGLNEAFKAVYSDQHSFIAWCFGLPERTAEQIQAVIGEAKRQSPAFRAQQFTIRPLSPGLTAVRTPETALINLIGIVRIFENISYGDLLTKIIQIPRRNSVLLGELEKRIPQNKWRQADCDRESPLPQLLVRRYSAYLEGEFSANRDSTLVSFLEELDELNNLAGLSDRALAARLASDPLVGPLPAQIKKLFERHQSN